MSEQQKKQAPVPAYDKLKAERIQEPLEVKTVQMRWQVDHPPLPVPRRQGGVVVLRFPPDVGGGDGAAGEGHDRRGERRAVPDRQHPPPRRRRGHLGRPVVRLEADDLDRVFHEQERRLRCPIRRSRTSPETGSTSAPG
jgi:hypothetical protein